MIYALLIFVGIIVGIFLLILLVVFLIKKFWRPV